MMLLASTSSPAAISASTSASGTRSMVIAASSALTAARVARPRARWRGTGRCTRRRSRASCRTRRAGRDGRRGSRSPPRARGRAVTSGASPSTSRLPAGTSSSSRAGGDAVLAHEHRLVVDRPAPRRPRRDGARRDGRTPRRRARDVHARRPRGTRRRRACSSRRPGTRCASVTRRCRVAGLDRQRQARQTTLGPVAGRLHERGEQRVRPVGAALELGVGLGAHEERVTRQLDELDQPVVGRGARADEPGLLEPAAVLVVDLVAVPVALVDDSSP